MPGCIWNPLTLDLNKVVRDCSELSVSAITPGHCPLQLLLQWVVRNRPLLLITVRHEILLPVVFIRSSQYSNCFLAFLRHLYSQKCQRKAALQSLRILFPAEFVRPNLKEQLAIKYSFLIFFQSLLQATGSVRFLQLSSTVY